MPNHYEILRVDRNADQHEINSSYRNLIRMVHPDRNPENPISNDFARDIIEAYQVLSDPDLR